MRIQRCMHRGLSSTNHCRQGRGRFQWWGWYTFVPVVLPLKPLVYYLGHYCYKGHRGLCCLSSVSKKNCEYIVLIVCCNVPSTYNVLEGHWYGKGDFWIFLSIAISTIYKFWSAPFHCNVKTCPQGQNQFSSTDLAGDGKSCDLGHKIFCCDS